MNTEPTQAEGATVGTVNAGTTDAEPGDESGRTGDDDASRDRRFATTLARGLSVLRAFRSGDDGLGNAEIAARARLPKSTVSRLTFTLRALGYLEQSRGDERYRPGPALLALGNVAAGAVSIVERATPPMQALADDTGTLAVLAVRDDRKLLLVRTWRPRGVASLWLEVGHRLPIARSSSGHALLAALSSDEVARLVDAAATEDGLADGRGERIHAQAFDDLQKMGHVIADPRDYFTPNIHAASVPFRASGVAEPIMFTCGATPADLTLERLRREVGPRLRAAVEELALITGGTVPTRTCGASATLPAASDARANTTEMPAPGRSTDDPSTRVPSRRAAQQRKTSE